MKFNYIKMGIIPALAVVLSLSSCLKDDNVDLDLTTTNKNFIGINDASPSSSSTNSTSVAVVSSSASVTVNLRLTYIGQAVSPGTAVTVKVETDSAKIVGPLNKARNTNYYVLKPANYALANTKLTIPAGEKSVILPVTLKPNTITNTNVSYALPITITDASGVDISGNYGSHVIIISIKNPYDGIYNATGQFIHPTAGPRPIDQEKTLSTIDPNTCETTVGDLTNTMRIVVNPTTNNVTYVGELSASQPIIPTPGKTSKYDPATKTFHLYYQYTGTGGFRVIEEDLVYSKSR